MKAAIVPIDNRPVTYVFPQLIARMAGVETLAPPRSLMGSLTADTHADQVSTWLNETLQRHNPDALLVCVDSLIYGGLIPSRRSDESTSQLLERAKVVPRWKKVTSKPLQVFAQSSIMRISDNYDNTEEKAYWSRFGREIFAWSEAMHRMSGTANGDLRNGELRQLESRIDAGVRQDYMNTRQRNFQVNRKLLDYCETGDIDFLVYSQDDSGQYGLNVLEKERLLTEANRRKLKNVIAYAGADEVLLTLLSRWLVKQAGQPPMVKVSFSPADGGNILSRYEGQTIGNSVSSQLAAAGLTASDSPLSDFHLIIHTSGSRQGDHIWLSGHDDLRQLDTTASVQQTLTLIEQSAMPVVLCDVAYSNGADPILLEQLLERRDLMQKLWGYAGWNTTGNSLGSAIAMGIACWYAKLTGGGERASTALKTALFVRLADDWAYQTQVRKELGNNLALDHLRKLMEPHLKKLAQSLAFAPGSVELSLPWQRSFEVEVRLPDLLQPIR